MAFTLLALIANGIVALNKLHQISDYDKWVGHTHEVRTALADLLSTVKDAETGQRGYVVTGDKNFLEPYQAALARLKDVREQVRTLTADNAAQQEGLKELDPLLSAKMAELAYVIELRAKSGFDVAREHVATGIGKNYMDGIRQVIARMDNDEANLLQQRQLKSHGTLFAASATLLIATLISVGFMGIAFYTLYGDIAERQRNARALFERHELLRVTMSSIGDAVIATDKSSIVTRLNPAAENLTGWTDGSGVGRSLNEIFKIINEHTRQPAKNPIERALREGIIVGLANHTVLVARDGKEYPIDDCASPIKDANGNILGAVLVFRDVSQERLVSARLEQSAQELKAANERLEERVRERTRELQESEEQFRLLVANVEDYAIFLLDPQGYVKSWNLGAERINGYLASEIIGQHFSRFYPPEDVKAGKTERELQTATTQGHVEDEGWRVRKDGTRFWANVVITALRDTQGRLRGFTKVVRDMTDRKRADEAREKLINEQIARATLEHSSRMKDEFLAVLSHELRTPLTPMLGWTRMMRSAKLDRDMLTKGLDVIERNIRAQVTLIEDLLDISRIISGKIRLEFRATGLAQVIETAMESIRPMAEAKNIKLSFGMASSVGPIRGDPDRLQQVLWNLLNNAVKFTQRGGEVSVSLARVDTVAEIRVTDNGEGISAEFVPRMFQRFSQSDSTTTRKHGGLGIGLSISRQLVELHGGSISVESAGPGKGTTFTVRLPIPAVKPVVADKPDYTYRSVDHAVSEPRLIGQKILVVDDEADAREILGLILERFGATVETASSAAEALEKLVSFSADVVVCDIGMPVEDGYSLIRKLRQRGDNVPAVAVTAYARSDDRRRALKEGFQFHIPKPVDPAELCRIVCDLIKPDNN